MRRVCYSPRFVIEPLETIGSSAGAVEEEPPQKSSSLASLQQLSAAMVSSACPGAGHLILGQIPKGMMLSGIFVALLCGFWPLRLLRFYVGFVILFLGWLSLASYSTCSAQLIRNPKTAHRVSKWWFVGTLPVALIICSLTGAALTRASGFRSFSVPSTSMEPTIQIGDRIVVDTHSYRHSPPQHRDSIVIYRGGTYYIKRIIAFGGDTVAGRTDGIIVNGNMINESYVQHSGTQSAVNWEAPGYDSAQSFGPVAVPTGKYFVMGDNRDVSIDSRSPDFGFIDQPSVLGKVLYVYSTAREGARVR